MLKKKSILSVERRVAKSLKYFGEGDAEEAIYSISPVLDVIAKIRSKNKGGVGKRVKAYLFDEQSLIYYLSSQGNIDMPDGCRLVMVNFETDERIGGNGGELADFVYHNIRCAQAHDADIDYKFIDFGREFGVGRYSFNGDGGELAPGVFIISRATVLAIILSVIAAKECQGIKLPGDINLYNRVRLDRTKLVGNKKYLMKKVRELFPPNAANKVN